MQGWGKFTIFARELLTYTYTITLTYHHRDMKISVIIPTFRPQDYLWECLDSMRSQTFPHEDFEVILVLNGAAEPYKGQIEQYLDTHMQGMNVRFIYTEQGGVSHARNLGLDVAQGDYITFVDDDDFISPRYLELLYDKAGADTIPLCYPLAFMDGTADYEPYFIAAHYREHPEKERYDFVKARKYFSGSVYKLVRREAIGSRRFDVRFRNGEDSLFMFLISDTFRYVAFASKDAVYYRRIRRNSAVTARRSRLSIVWNEIRRDVEIVRIYCSAPSQYRMRFFLTFLLASLSAMARTVRTN